MKTDKPSPAKVQAPEIIGGPFAAGIHDYRNGRCHVCGEPDPASPDLPAFPHLGAHQRGGMIEVETFAPGMSLGCYVSASALSGMLANPDFEPVKSPGERSEDAYARRAVDYAEALLAEVNRREATIRNHEQSAA